jgi:hypothetical protein
MKAWMIVLIILLLAGVVYAYNNPNVFSSIKNKISVSNPLNSYTSIGDIIKNPDSYFNKDVKIKGIGYFYPRSYGSSTFETDIYDQSRTYVIHVVSPSEVYNGGCGASYPIFEIYGKVVMIPASMFEQQHSEIQAYNVTFLDCQSV